MANQNKPTGFTPVKYLNGADWDGKGNIYFIPYSDGSAYYVGDMVTLIAGVDQWSGLQTIELGAASQLFLGSILAIGASPSETVSNRGGPYINPNDLTKTYAPATKTQNYFALVADDPMIVYEAQEIVVSAHAALTYTSTSKNVNYYAGTPASGVYVSGSGIDNNTVNTTNTLPLKLLGLSQRIDPQSALYNTFGAYAKWLCKINSHPYGNIAVGV